MERPHAHPLASQFVLQRNTAAGKRIWIGALVAIAGLLVAGVGGYVARRLGWETTGMVASLVLALGAVFGAQAYILTDVGRQGGVLAVEHALLALKRGRRVFRADLGSVTITPGMHRMHTKYRPAHDAAVITIVGLDPAGPVTIGADTLVLGWSCDAPRVRTPTYLLAQGDFERLSGALALPIDVRRLDRVAG